MGALLAKFRKEKTTEQKLEQLEEKIKEIEKYAYNTQEKKKRFVGTFLAVSIGVYVIAFIFIYFVYLPETWKERWLYLVPLLIIPFIIVLLRRLFTWYFQRKLNKNSDKLTELRTEKKNILEQVMDKETYKVAVNLLTRFGDRSTSSNRLSFGLTQRPSATPVTNTQTSTRTLANRSITQLGPITPQPGSLLASRNTPVRPTNQQLVATSQNLALTAQGRSDQQLRRRTPFPIVNQADKNIFERCLDLLIGDGPQDRFAVICRECLSHNGMALKEEFDYIAYRCAFCNALNPARKTRPVGPRLALQALSPNSSKNSNSGDSANNTPTDLSEDDEPEPFERRNQLRLTESTANRSESDSSSDDVITNHEASAVGTAAAVATTAAAATETKVIETPSAVYNEPEPMDISSSENNQKPSDYIEDTHETQNTEVNDALKKTN